MLEVVQKRAIRMTSGLKVDSYEEKFNQVKMTSLEECRLRGDIIQTLKILNGKDPVQETIGFRDIQKTKDLKQGCPPTQ